MLCVLFTEELQSLTITGIKIRAEVRVWKFHQLLYGSCLMLIKLHLYNVNKHQLNKHQLISIVVCTYVSSLL